MSNLEYFDPTTQVHHIRNFVYLASSFAQIVRDGLSGPVNPQQQELLGHIVDCMARTQALLVPATGNSPSTGSDPRAE